MSTELASAFVSVKYTLDEGSLARAKSTVTRQVDAMERAAVVEGTFDDDKLEQGLKSGERKVESSAREMGATFARWFAADKVIEQFNRAITAASDLEQSVGGSRAVFGDWANIIDDAATGAAASMGLSENAARQLTSQIGGLLKGFGFTQEEAANTSVALAQLGADLAATFGGSPEEAVNALGAALRGEFDPLERFGISLNQTQINLRAVEMGLADSTSNVDQNARAQAALAIIAERSADAQGQFARETDTAAGKAAIARAEFENARAEMGERLLPVFTRAVDVVSSLVDVFTALPGPVQTGLVAMIGIAAIAGPVRDVTKAFGGLSSIIGKLGTGGAGALAGLSAAIGIGLIAYQSFTAEQRQTDENTRDATDALRLQYPALLDAARAAADASGHIDGVALANQALSLSLAEGNDALTDSLGRLNIGASDTLTILSAYEASGENQLTVLDNLARSYGLTADQAEVYGTTLYRSYKDGQFITEEDFKRAEALGINRERYIELNEAVNDFYDAVDNTDIQKTARDFPDAQVTAKGYEGSLAQAAEAQAGFDRATGDAAAVYRIWSQLVAESGAEVAGVGDAATGAAGNIDLLTGATTGAANAIKGALPLWKLTTTGLKEVSGGLAESGAQSGKAAGDFGSAAKEGKDLGDALATAGDAAGNAYKPIDQMVSATSDLDREMENAKDAADDLMAAINRILDPTDEMRDTTRAVWDEMDKLVAAFEEGKVALNETGTDFTTTTDAGRRMQEQFEANRDAILENAAAMVRNGSSQEEAAAAVAWNTEALRQQLIAAGYTEAEVDNLIATYGLMPDQVMTYIGLAGKEEAQRKLEEHAALIARMPTSTQTHIQALIDVGAWNLVNSQLNLLTQPRSVAVAVSTATKQSTQISNLGPMVPQLRAKGGVIDRPELAWIGEADTEVVLPKDPSRIAQILGDPRAAPITAGIRDALGGDTNVGGSLTVNIGSVGSARDMPRVRDEIDEAYWRFKLTGAR